MSRRSQLYEIEYIPFQFHLTKSNVAIRVVIPRRAKLDELRFIFIAKSRFRGLVEASKYVLHVVLEG